MLNSRQVRNAAEDISRGNRCPACKADWDRPRPPAAWTLTHAEDCEYMIALDRLDRDEPPAD